MGFNRGPKTATYNIDVLYDTLNVKSYVGEPTTNLVSSNPTFNGVSGTQTHGETTSWVFSGIGPDRNGFAYYNSETSPIGLKFPNEGAVITVGPDNQEVYTSNRRIYQYLTISPNTTYTVSHWFYRSGGVGAGCAIFQYSDSFSTYIGGDYLIGYDSVSNAGEWTLYSQTFTSLPTAQTIIIGPVISWQTPVLFAMQRFQIEQKSRRTNFTIGSRTSTQGLIDLSRNKTINLSNVSFIGNSSLSFDGTNDYITISPRRQYGTNEEWTAELIINPQNTTQTSWNGIFGGDLNAGGYWMFHGGGQLAYYDGVYGGNANLAYTGLGLGSTFPDNTHTHLVITYNGAGNYVIYVNGVVATNYNFSFGGSYSLDLQRIGGPSDRFGTVDVPYFKMYSTILTPTQVDLNYQALKSRYDTLLSNNGVMFHVDANNPNSYIGSGTIWNDISGNDYDFTLVNGPVFETHNGLRTFKFSGTNDYAIRNGSINHDVGTEATIFVVMASIDNSDFGSCSRLVSFNDGSGTNLDYSNYFSLPSCPQNRFNLYYRVNPGPLDAGIAMKGPTDPYNILAFSWIAGSSAKQYINGSLVASTTTVASAFDYTTVQRMTFAVNAALTLENSYVRISEVIMYERQMNDAEVSRTSETLKKKYNVS